MLRSAMERAEALERECPEAEDVGEDGSKEADSMPPALFPAGSAGTAWICTWNGNSLTLYDDGSCESLDLDRADGRWEYSEGSHAVAITYGAAGAHLLAFHTPPAANGLIANGATATAIPYASGGMSAAVVFDSIVKTGEFEISISIDQQKGGGLGLDVAAIGRKLWVTGVDPGGPVATWNEAAAMTREGADTQEEAVREGDRLLSVSGCAVATIAEVRAAIAGSGVLALRFQHPEVSASAAHAAMEEGGQPDT